MHRDAPLKRSQAGERGSDLICKRDPAKNSNGKKIPTFPRPCQKNLYFPDFWAQFLNSRLFQVFPGLQKSCSQENKLHYIAFIQRMNGLTYFQELKSLSNKHTKSLGSKVYDVYPFLSPHLSIKVKVVIKSNLYQVMVKIGFYNYPSMKL